MFIVSLTYVKDFDIVDSYLEKHVEYLKEQYEKGFFIASGRKVPRTGGVILSDIKEKEELMNILKKDPFYKNQVAEYDITEFVPSMTSKELDFLTV
ncbi:YciI family protein [Tepidibacter hydrothermalis]|uniref:YciI family protein n=1 Tax=Tepidibacter hydrothermalis TaxID=3036126 RepID=A0ABY8E8H3_9FIRM|nr:YciI family protein [Tepidibacter hydrothermalis]WFD09121.1 YciI family protein [Tepidibacter hydrothermalis]